MYWKVVLTVETMVDWREPQMVEQRDFWLAVKTALMLAKSMGHL